MAVDHGKFRKDQMPEGLHRSSQKYPGKYQVRTILMLGCCGSCFLLLPLFCRVISCFGSSFGYSCVPNHNVTTTPHLENLYIPEARSEMGTSAWEYSGPATAAAAAMERRTTRLPEGEKYMWYSPHSGFSNQARELMYALKIAFLLNRTLILPPVLDHFEIEQGLCLRPVHAYRKLRKLAWAAITGRFRPSSPRTYVSMADIIDLSSIKSIVKTIDVRVFLALWCDIDFSPTCLGPFCRNLATALATQPHGSISSCAKRFFSTPEGSKSSNLIGEVPDDCTTTIWTHGESPHEKTSLEHYVIEQLQNDTSLPSKVGASSLHIRRKDIIETLGPASSVGKSFLMTFGTTFGKSYGDGGRTLMVDINGSLLNQRTASNLQAIEHQAFSKGIVNAGQLFVERTIQKPFFCAHVRLEDGAFLFHQESHIFKPLRQRLQELEMMSLSNQTTREPINIFVMTDLPREKWPGNYLYQLDNNPKYKLHTMDGQENLLNDVMEKIEFHEYGLLHSFFPQLPNLSFLRTNENSPQDKISRPSVKDGKGRNSHAFDDIRLFVEEVICSCAKLGFQGTKSSTLTNNILKMRTAEMCPI